MQKVRLPSAIDLAARVSSDTQHGMSSPSSPNSFSSSSSSSSSVSPPAAFAARRAKQVRIRARNNMSSHHAAAPSVSSSSSASQFSYQSKLFRRARHFLSDPTRTVPIAFGLFAVAYFLLFDIRTHLILLCAFLGLLLLLTSTLLAISNAGGLLSFVSPTTQHMLLDYNLLELIKISWHSRTLQDIMSLVIFPLSRAERKRIIERLPSKLSAVLTRRGIVHLLPKPAKRIFGSGSIQQQQQGNGHVAQEESVAVERVRDAILSSSSQPNLVLLDQAPSHLEIREATPSPSPNAPTSTSSAGFNRSRSMSALPEAADAAQVEAAEDEELEEEFASSSSSSGAIRRRPFTGIPLESKDDLEDEDGSWVDTNASIVSTSSSSSSSSSSGSSSSGSSTPDLNDADVRNYDECTPSPAHLYFSGAHQTGGSFSFSNASVAVGASTSGTGVSSSTGYRAPLSTFLPLPSHIDDLNFSNLLDRQIREHAKEGIKNMGRAMVEGVQESFEHHWQEVRQYIPANLLPYCTWHHARILLPIASGLAGAQLFIRSPRFRALLLRAIRLGFDAGVLSTALYAAVTAYRELTVNIQTPRFAQPASSPRHSPQPSMARVSSPMLSPVALLPSLSMYRRVHSLPANAGVSNFARSFHSLKVFFAWLMMRYRASGQLRKSTVILMVWFAWLARNTSLVQTQKEQIVERVRRVFQRGEL